jgi:hypothetical protein
MSKQNKLLIALGFIAVLVYIVYSTMGLAQVTCDVGVEFRGRTVCRAAYGVDRNEALSTAQNVACAELASGRDESIACTGMTQPKTLKCSQ